MIPFLIIASLLGLFLFRLGYFFGTLKGWADAANNTKDKEAL